MINYWLHRISYHAEVSYPLLENNRILTIGFSDFATHQFIDDILKGDTWQERWKVLENMFDEIWGIRPRTRHNLWRFIEGFKKGDKIIVPSWGTFSIYELVSEKPKPITDLMINELEDWNGKILTKKNGFIYSGDNQIDLGFYWEVKPIAEKISREQYADASLTARMKIRVTNALISDLKNNIETAINSYKNNKPINLYSEIMDKIRTQVLNSVVSKLNPDKFEKLVKYYFERIGANSVYIPAKNENGKEGDADIVATFEPIKTIIYVQVKFHALETETNEWAVQQIKEYKNNKEVMDDGYTKIGWVITSANNFSDESLRIAQEEGIHLIDGKRFAEMIIDAGLSDLNNHSL